MAIIPLNQKFHTIENSVVTKERGSSLVNSQKEIYVTQDIIDTVSASIIGLAGTQYVFVKADGTDLENAVDLITAYATAQGMSPSATNRITVIAAPGNYNFDNADFKMTTQYIDLVSLDGNRSIVFNGSFTIEITANNVFVRGVDVGTLNFTIATSLNLLKVENCRGGNNSFGGYGTASGTFTNCTGGNKSFSGNGGTASGTFINCTGGADAFGGQGIASGVFNSCTGGDFSFGGGNLASGTFTNCQGGDHSFGGQVDASGTFTNCTGGYGSFGGDSGTANGTFTSCIGGNISFGGYGTASGTFTSCTGGDSSFGGNGGTASGVFNSCIGGVDAFGKSGTLNGFLYYCRLTSGGTYETVSGSGRTVLCIDGSNNQNNQ